MDIIGDSLQELAHVIMETKKSHSLPSASWRTRKAGGIIRWEELCEPMSEGRRLWMSQLKQKANLPFPQLFVLFRPSTDWVMPTHPGEGNLFYSVY